MFGKSGASDSSYKLDRDRIYVSANAAITFEITLLFTECIFKMLRKLKGFSVGKRFIIHKSFTKIHKSLLLMSRNY